MVFGGPAVYGCRVARANGGKAKKKAAKKSAAAKSDAPKRGTAPSAANIKDLDKFEASDEAKAHEPSDVDAMGQDKRRDVIGQSYGPSKKRQLAFFGIVALVIAILLGGAYAAVQAFDQPEDEYADQAPWSQSDAQQVPALAPGNPCGEPGNPYPAPDDSPCKSRFGLTAEEGGPRSEGAEEGPGGVTEASGESASDSQ